MADRPGRAVPDEYPAAEYKLAPSAVPRDIAMQLIDTLVEAEGFACRSLRNGPRLMLSAPPFKRRHPRRIILKGHDQRFAVGPDAILGRHGATRLRGVKIMLLP